MILELCLATAIFFEARDQSIEGQIAVAEVILNRVDSPLWPNPNYHFINDGGFTRGYAEQWDGTDERAKEMGLDHTVCGITERGWRISVRHHKSLVGYPSKPL